MPSPFTVNAMGSGVAVGGSGVKVAVGVEAGVGEENEAHAESPSAKRQVQIFFMCLRRRNIVPDYKIEMQGRPAGRPCKILRSFSNPSHPCRHEARQEPCPSRACR